MTQNDSCSNGPLLTLREGAAFRFHMQLNYNQHCPPDLIKTLKRAFPSSHYLLPFGLYELMTSKPLCGLQIVPTCVLNSNSTTENNSTQKQAVCLVHSLGNAGVNINSCIMAASTVRGQRERAEAKAANLLMTHLSRNCFFG